MNKPHNKGPWFHRFLIWVFSIALAVLCYWLLGFIVDDLGGWPGPDYAEIEGRLLDQSLVEREKSVADQIADVERKIDDQKMRQSLLSDSTANSQRTMNQLLEFQRLSLEKNVTPTADEQKALAESQQRFLANQQQYQALNTENVQLNELLRELKRQQRDVQQKLEQARQPVWEEFNELQRRHNLKIAALKLAVLIPLLLVAVFLFVRLRGGSYAPIVYAFGIAVVLKVGVVMHEYFPARYFKYILILVALAIVIRILVYLLRMVAFPKQDWLLKQYREAYEVFQCPICSYPIRRGPLKFAYWTRRSIKRISRPAESDGQADEPYTCPTCSTALYEKCEKCEAVRPSLLPTCQNCGQTKSLESMEQD